MIFQVRSRYDVEKRNDCGYPHIIISICSTKDRVEPNIVVNPLTKDILRMRFDDFDRPVSGYSLFTTIQAETIEGFVNKNFDCQVCIIHCHMGLSRSPAIAAALNKYYNDEDENFFKVYTPNMHVYRIMLNSLFETKDIG